MSFSKLQALVIEDEMEHQKALVDALNESHEIEVAGIAGSIADAFDLVKNTPADIAFLDIELIGGDAFQLIKLLKHQHIPIPPVVIQTGRGKFEHAQKIYDEFKDDVISILQKPFYEDWEKRRDNIIEAIYVKKQAARLADVKTVPHFISIQDGRQTYLLNPADIVMVKTGAKSQGRTEVVLQHKTIECNLSLSQLLLKLPGEFIQINRFEAINIAWIEMLDQANREVLLRNGESLLIGPKFYPMLYELVAS